MSASLVGSEMCIRDSSSPPLAVGQLRSLAGSSSLSEGPVSYTHLTLPTIYAVCRSRWSPYH
eukprot:449017-Alexandrium_andersonii.AAC.1